MTEIYLLNRNKTHTFSLEIPQNEIVTIAIGAIVSTRTFDREVDATGVQFRRNSRIRRLFYPMFPMQQPNQPPGEYRYLSMSHVGQQYASYIQRYNQPPDDPDLASNIIPRYRNCDLAFVCFYV